MKLSTNGDRNLKKVDLDPACVTDSDSSTLKIIVKNKSSPLKICFEEPGDLLTFQNALTGYKVVYRG